MGIKNRDRRSAAHSYKSPRDNFSSGSHEVPEHIRKQRNAAKKMNSSRASEPEPESSSNRSSRSKRKRRGRRPSSSTRKAKKRLQDAIIQANKQLDELQSRI